VPLWFCCLQQTDTRSVLALLVLDCCCRCYLPFVLPFTVCRFAMVLFCNNGAGPPLLFRTIRIDSAVVIRPLPLLFAGCCRSCCVPRTLAVTFTTLHWLYVLDGLPPFSRCRRLPLQTLVRYVFALPLDSNVLDGSNLCLLWCLGFGSWITLRSVLQCPHHSLWTFTTFGFHWHLFHPVAAVLDFPRSYLPLDGCHI